MKELSKKVLMILLALLIAALPLMNKGAMAEEGAQSAADTEGATVFNFSESGISAERGKYTGYAVEENEVKIEGSGTYVLKGASSDASIKVRRDVKGVYLVLDGLELTSQTTAPIACAKSSEVTIIAAAGTVNTLSDTELNNDETHADNLDAENAVIKCKDGSKVVICGEGSLNIIANGKNGIKGGASTELEGESSLTIKELALSIKANVNDALKSDSDLHIESGNITIEAADDGIKSDYILNIGAQNGDGPNIEIVSSSEGIEAAALNVYSGNIVVNSIDDGINAANSDLSGYSFACNFYGGRVVVNTTTGDGIDSNGKVNFAGGALEVYSSTRSDNSPFDSDGEMILTSGTVFGIGMPGMGGLPTSVEQAYVVFGSSGRDGIGGGRGGRGDWGGRGGFSGENGEMPRPAADANGEVTWTPDAQSGATGRASKPDSGMSGQPDQGGSALGISEGDSVEIVDANGSVLYSVTAKRSASYVFLSSSMLNADESCTLLVNGEETASAQASMTASSGFKAWANDGTQGGRQQGEAQSPQDGAGSTGEAEHQSGGESKYAEVQSSNGDTRGATDFARIIGMVLTAAGLIAVGCIASIVTLRAKNGKRTASAVENAE